MCKKREGKAPPAWGAEQLDVCKHNCEPNGWPCVLPQAFEDVQTQMMDFTRQTAKCHILGQPGLAWQTNIPARGGTGWGWLEEPHPLWIYWFALLNSTDRAVDWEQHCAPSAQASTAADGGWTQLWAPKSRGMLIKPFCTGAWARALHQPLPTSAAAIQCSLGKKQQQGKEQTKIFPGLTNHSAAFSPDSFQALQGSCPAASVQPLPLRGWGSAPGFYCHKVIVHFWSAFCHSNYNYQGFNQTNKRTFYRTLGMLMALPKHDNLDGAAVTTAVHTAALSPRMASCGSFGRTCSKYWLC